jgi:hypothetical protein
MNTKHLTAAKLLLKKAKNLNRLVSELNAATCDALDEARKEAKPLVDFLTGLNDILCNAERQLDGLPDGIEIDGDEIEVDDE